MYVLAPRGLHGAFTASADGGLEIRLRGREFTYLFNSSEGNLEDSTGMASYFWNVPVFPGKTVHLQAMRRHASIRYLSATTALYAFVTAGGQDVTGFAYWCPSWKHIHNQLGANSMLVMISSPPRDSAMSSWLVHQSLHILD